MQDGVALIPPPPQKPVIANILRVALPGILTFHERRALAPVDNWPSTLQAQPDLCFLTVIERHGKNGGVGYGLLQDFGSKAGAVASSVGHDAHNLIIAGTNEADMRVALDWLRTNHGGVCVVRDGVVLAGVPLPIAGLLSDQRAEVVAEETRWLKKIWTTAGCLLPYMGFNLLPLSVIPEIRLTDKGLVTVPGMQVVPLFEEAD